MFYFTCRHVGLRGPSDCKKLTMRDASKLDVIVAWSASGCSPLKADLQHCPASLCRSIRKRRWPQLLWSWTPILLPSSVLQVYRTIMIPEFNQPIC